MRFRQAISCTTCFLCISHKIACLYFDAEYLSLHEVLMDFIKRPAGHVFADLCNWIKGHPVAASCECTFK